MAIIRFGERPFYRDPWVEFERISREMDRLARGLYGEPSGGGRATVYPAVNIAEDENNIYVRAEIAGVTPDAIDLSIEGDTLTIKGERKTPATSENVSYHRQEVEYGHFSRAISLPKRVDTGRVEARSENGILHLTLPKAEEVKPRRIQVAMS